MKKRNLVEQIKELVKATGITYISGQGADCKRYALKADKERGIRSIDELPRKSRRTTLSDLKQLYEQLHRKPYQPTKA